MTRKKLFLYGLVVAALMMILLFWGSQVSTEITYSDRSSLKNAGALFKPDESVGFDSEIRTIRAIQKAAFKVAPRTWPIAVGASREPEDLVELGYGNCNDRSRFLDKALRLAGFETRYASLYETAKTGSAFLSLITRDTEIVRSHALVEVKTSRGWMFVDSVSPWLALEARNNPVGLERWQNEEDKAGFSWLRQPGGEIYFLMKDDFTYVYGLYSRHGQFYPPYVPVPDIDWFGMLENF
ncbi:transglutaminase family protein [Alphaproteobacteria bacterium]|nr:transglutaminase family protein [Alphaproteobacteria bacterium]